MNQSATTELMAVLGALLLAFLLATSDAVTQSQLTLLILALAWIGIASGLCWMVITAKRGLQHLWAALLDGVAVETK